MALGHGGREGRFSGALASLLALATLGRMAIVASGAAQDESWAALRAWAPGLMWLLAGALLLVSVRAKPALADAPQPLKRS